MRSLVFVFLMLVAGIGLSCSSPFHEPKPDHYGLFMVAKGELVELKKLNQTQMRSLVWNGILEGVPNSGPSDPKLYFIMYGFQEPILQRVVVDKGHYDTNAGQHLDMQMAPIKGETQMFRLQPVPPLAPGTYELSVPGCPESPSYRCYFPVRLK